MFAHHSHTQKKAKKFVFIRKIIIYNTIKLINEKKIKNILKISAAVLLTLGIYENVCGMTPQETSFFQNSVGRSMISTAKISEYNSPNGFKSLGNDLFIETLSEMSTYPK